MSQVKLFPVNIIIIVMVQCVYAYALLRPPSAVYITKSYFNSKYINKHKLCHKPNNFMTLNKK